jgi:HCOMODA/2-hydroxy-3-carboxy-muconic semialdehyde decarboxylase
MTVADTLSASRTDLSIANRMLANEGIFDAFGHTSMRHPTNPNRYLLSRSRAPQLVEPGDVLEFDLDSNPIDKKHPPLYSERVIHGEIYKARPDVMAVCHHHAPAFMPLLICGIDFVPVFHLGAVGGVKPPFWDQRKEFGDCNYLVVTPEEGASLAARLAAHNMVLMNRHGVTVVGTSIQACVFRSIYSARNAEYQVAAANTGALDPLSPGDAKISGDISTSTTGLNRAWEVWLHRLAQAGGLPPAQKKLGGVTRGASASGASSKAAASKAPAKVASKSKSKFRSAKKRRRG